jgi:hypothetical protein
MRDPYFEKVNLQGNQKSTEAMNDVLIYIGERDLLLEMKRMNESDVIE